MSDEPLAVVVDDLKITYRTFASGKSAGSGKTLMRKQRGVKKVEALKGVSFAVREGESVGVVGHNGSGKSTLMRAVAGLISPSNGRVYASERPVLLGVNAALLSELPGSDNIMIGGLAMGLSRKEVEAKFDDIVDFSGLAEFIDYPMKTYSSGMSARLRFSIAASVQHSVLLIDEALAVGDKEFREKSEQRIREMREHAGTVFLVSHSMQSIRSTCDRVIWIDHGELKMDGEPNEVIAAYQKSKGR